MALGEHALRTWRAYVDLHGPMRYVESVVGTRQEVDPHLPADALDAARLGRDGAEVERRYNEPLAALQDADLAFPEPVAFAYYAVYYVFRRYAQGEAVDDGLIVDQALSSEEDAEAGVARLAEALRAARAGA